MKLILALLGLLMISSVSANDQQAFSKLIANNYQSMMDELEPGNYLTNILVIYRYEIGEENSVTVPVLFIPSKVTIPSEMKDCSQDYNSIACKIAAASLNWYDMAQPAVGEFQVYLHLGVKVSKLTFPIDDFPLRQP